MRMQWYNYVACFFAGVFAVNSLPHFIHGISGDFFPTPFANPPGKGLSAPLLNVAWAFFNMIVGALLFRAGNIAKENKWTIILFVIGIAAMSVRLSFALAKKVH